MTSIDTDSSAGAPHISINAQYVKDLSFESPSAPASLLERNPQIELSLEIRSRNLPEENYYEVELEIEAKARSEKHTLFIIELKYAGVFNFINIPADQIPIFLSIHCPSMLFPFARRIIANATQDGGFQPLMIDPIDFGALYYKKISENQN